MVRLSPRTAAIARRMFGREEYGTVARLLAEECADSLPFAEHYDEIALERIRFAVLKNSLGNVDRLLDAIELAQVDWRDALMVAGFGHSLTAHEEWAEELLR